jgi:RNA polymerase sigma-70 factor (ECF subfamily)
MGAERSPSTDAARRLDDLFQAHERRVLAYAMRRTPSLADAEDAAAETFAIAWRKIEQAPDEALPWLLSIARRVISNQRRGGQRRTLLSLKLGRHMTAESDVVPEAGAADEADGPVLAALGRLRSDDQEILRLVAWEELDNRAVGFVLGITPNAVAIRLHRARKRFRDELLKEPGGIRTSTEQKGAANGALQERVE